ncbi:MAG: hypothetical protein VX453_09350 [Acidobacteriota bacterium]|nr:hypothetical protein [Acidobacteriota bacterium]
MGKRFVSALVAVIGVVVVSPMLAVAGQTSGSDMARTPWGDPDLQGTWSYASLTPLQRPTSMTDKEFFTAEEAAQRNYSVTLDQPPTPGSVGSYNALWFDRGEVSSDLRTSLIVDPPSGRLPTRPEVTARQAARRGYLRDHPADSWVDRTNWDRCITYHGVPPISTGYNNTYQILQTPTHVAIRVENIHDVRIIPIDGRPQLNDAIRQWNGASRAHWEGDTLVVETLNFSDKTVHRFPSSQNTRAVERFRRVNDDEIDYRFTIEDPSVYSQPWTAVRPMPRLDDYIIYEYACHEGNYAMTNILTVERVQENEAGR